MNPVYDLERLLSKVTYKTANPRDLIAFRNSLQMLPPIKTVLSGFQKEELAAIREEIDGLEDIYQLIDEAIVEEPPISIREGGMPFRLVCSVPESGTAFSIRLPEALLSAVFVCQLSGWDSFFYCSLRFI